MGSDALQRQRGFTTEIKRVHHGDTEITEKNLRKMNLEEIELKRDGVEPDNG
jgi:hypothetical protein